MAPPHIPELVVWGVDAESQTLLQRVGSIFKGLFGTPMMRFPIRYHRPATAAAATAGTSTATPSAPNTTSQNAVNATHTGKKPKRKLPQPLGKRKFATKSPVIEVNRKTYQLLEDSGAFVHSFPKANRDALGSKEDPLPVFDPWVKVLKRSAMKFQYSAPAWRERRASDKNIEDVKEDEEKVMKPTKLKRLIGESNVEDTPETNSRARRVKVFDDKKLKATRHTFDIKVHNLASRAAECQLWLKNSVKSDIIAKAKAKADAGTIEHLCELVSKLSLSSDPEIDTLGDLPELVADTSLDAEKTEPWNPVAFGVKQWEQHVHTQDAWQAELAARKAKEMEYLFNSELEDGAHFPDPRIIYKALLAKTRRKRSLEKRTIHRGSTPKMVKCAKLSALG